jgi:hypothetical protein
MMAVSSRAGYLSMGGERMDAKARVGQHVIAFSKYGETAQQALARIAAAINAHITTADTPVMVQAMSHTVTQLTEPIPPLPGLGDPGPDYFVVTALVTFSKVS